MITGGPVSFTATPASVCDSALTETGYVGELSDWQNRSREVNVAGNSRTVTLNNYVNAYNREGPDGENATEDKGGFAVLATPQAEAFGQAVNPIRTWSPRQMVENLAGGLNEYGTLQNIQQADSDQVTVLGQQTTRTRFTATGQNNDGDPTDVYVEVLRVSHQGDFLVLGGVYNQTNPDERNLQNTLLGCIEHTATSDDTTPEQGAGTPTPVDADGDGYAATSSDGIDCDDNDPDNNPGAEEVRDGKDNDCDGKVDEGTASSTG